MLPNRLDNFHPEDYYFSHKDLLDIYSHLKKCGYSIITKTRPKTVKLYGKIEEKFLGDLHVVSNFYPKISKKLIDGAILKLKKNYLTK